MSKRYAQALGTELERTNALSAAMWAWRALLVIPLAAFAAVMATAGLGPSGGAWLEGWGLLFLVVALLCLALVAPPVYILRSHCFRAAWRGKPIDPPSYVRGLITVWVVLEMTVLLSLASCVASGALLPGVLPGALALMLLAFSGPSARALGLDEPAGSASNDGA